MQLNLAATLPVVLSLAFGGAFVANEWSHGGVARSMGMGHQHMLDYGGYHCVDHDDARHHERHMNHMHGNVTMPHDRCPGGGNMNRGMGSADRPMMMGAS